jgi:hypothetical protein
MQRHIGRMRDKTRLHLLTLVAAMLMSYALGIPVATATDQPSGSIAVFQSLLSYSAATRITQTIGFDDVATGTALGNPASQGSITIQHSTAATFETIGSPAFIPVSPLNVLAPFRTDGTFESGDTTLTFKKNVRAAGLFLIIGQGSNQDATWTSTVTATDTKDKSVTVIVSFQGVVGEQQFIGFQSKSKLASISFTVGSMLGATTVVAMDNIVIG